MVILNKEIQYTAEELVFLNKFLAGSENENIFILLNGKDKKLNVLNNCAGEIEDLPKGYVIKVSNKKDKLILIDVQKKNILEKYNSKDPYKMNIKLDTITK